MGHSSSAQMKSGNFVQKKQDVLPLETFITHEN